MSARISFDKPYDLRGEVSPRMISNVDEMLGQLYWSVAQLETKLSGGQGFLTSQNTTLEQETTGSNIGSLSHWPIGPWTFGATPTPGAYLDVGTISTGTYNNFEPSGMDYVVVLDIEPSGGTVTLTGLKSRADFRPRMLLIRNVDTSNSLVLKHLNSGSAGKNQFRLPSSTDITVGARQAVWLFFDPSAGLWTSAITTHTSGGLASTSNVSLVSVSLTEGQLEALSATPVQVIAAAGTNTIVIPIMWAYQIDVSTAYSNAPTVRLRYTGNASNLVNTIGSRASSLDISHATNTAIAFAEGVGTFDPRNTDVEVSFDTALTGAGAATAKVRVIYYTADFS